MGFNTYLSVDDVPLLVWRKYASPLPRFLFRSDQLIISSQEDVAGVTIPSISWQSTSGEALATLDEAGLGWAATVRAYAEVRLAGAFSSGLLHGSLYVDGTSDEAAEERLREFESLEPAEDLIALGRTMLYQWNQGLEEIVLLNDLSYDGDLPSFSRAAMETSKAAAEAKVANPIAAARAAESIALLHRDAPLLAWPVLVCTFLRHLPPETPVSLDLSEAAWEEADDDDFTPARYANSYWEDSSASLAAHARLMARLFSVFAAADSRLGKEYWLVRSADAMDRVKASREEGRTSQEKGEALEDLMAVLLRVEEPELRLLEKNLRTQDAEIDLLVTNSLSDPFWVAQSSPTILIECKNRNTKSDVPDLRVFESKMKDMGALCRIGVFVSMMGFTRTFLQRLPNFNEAGGLIFAVSGANLEAMLAEGRPLTEWLRNEGLRTALAGRDPS